MGWSKVAHAKAHPMWHDIADGARYYFAHSYYCLPDNPGSVVGRCDYGIEFAVAMAQKNYLRVSFTLRKVHATAYSCCRNFVLWDGAA